MPTISIPEEVYQRLAARAAQLHVSVEQLVTPLLDLAAESGDVKSPSGSSADWQKTLDEWMAEVHKRSSRYPPGFRMDDSRDSIYQGCGE